MSTTDLLLYDYWRSSACYRVRIALNLKGLAYALKPVHLLRDGGEQHADAYRGVNPQQVVPALVDGQRVVRQSLAIIEYLDETRPHTPLLPPVPRDRAHETLALAYLAQRIECAPRQQAEIAGVARDRRRRQAFHHAIEAGGRRLLEAGLASTRRARAVNDVVTLAPVLHEGRDQLGRILQVGIDDDGGAGLDMRVSPGL